jgi:hypothetical protein
MALLATQNLVIKVKVENGRIKCGDLGGDLKVKGRKADDTPLQVTWVSDDSPQQRFRMKFRQMYEATNGWPFEGSAVPETDPGVSHSFTVKDEDADCKYSVLIAGVPELDPVIIVEKKR